MTRKRLYLIDGMSHIYRAYYAIRELRNSKGFPTNAVYGFTVMLRKLIAEEKPDYLAVALDPEGPTIRHERFEAYKATRKPMPEDLVVQLPYIRRVCEALRVEMVTVAGYEADDVIGTLTRKATQLGLQAIVVTSDKDMLQLVSDTVLLLDPMKDNLLLDAAKVVEKMGVRPEQVPDLLGLWGDSSDNIPGAPGIGEKGAKELIQAFGSLEDCLSHWDLVKKKTYRESLRDNQELIRTSRELATIYRDLPLELDPDALAVREPDHEAARKLFSDLEFRSMLPEFSPLRADSAAPASWARGQDLTDQVDRIVRELTVFLSFGYAPGAAAEKSVLAVGAAGGSGPPVVFDLRDASTREQWSRIATNPSISKICWDTKPICQVKESNLRPSGLPVVDLMLMAFLISPNQGDYSLDRWALEQLQMTLPPGGDGKGDLLDYAESDGLVQRLALEVQAVRQLHALLEPQLDGLGLRQVYQEIELPLVPVLAGMELAGIRIRPESLRQLSAAMEGQLSDLTDRIYRAAGTRFNINSPKQLGEVLFERLNLPATRKTRKTKGFSTDQSVLEELAQSYELPRLILEYRQVSKLKSTYVDTLPGLLNPRTGRIHTSFNQTGAATGRLSSSEPNLQNIPVRTEVGRSIRGAFVPEAGSRLISADYSQVELRVLAHLSRDEVLVDAFRHDEDIHERTAVEVFGAADPANRSEWRRRAKVINFGIVYGLSAFGLAQRLGIPREEAQAFIDAYFARYKGIRAWLDNTIEEARESGYVRTLFGRIRPIPDIHSKDYAVRQFAERTAVNSPIQGTAADIIKIAMIRVQKSLLENSLVSRMLLQVHDELVLEASESEVDRVQAMVRREMENAADLIVPLRVDLNVADNWKDMK